MVRTSHGGKHHRTQPGACLYESSLARFLKQQPLKSKATVTGGLPNIIRRSAWCDKNNISLVLFICWPYTWGGPNFSSFSLSCIRINPQHLTLFELRCGAALPASPLCLRLTSWALTFKSPWRREATAKPGAWNDGFVKEFNANWEHLLNIIYVQLCEKYSNLSLQLIFTQILTPNIIIRASCIKKKNK